VHQLCSTWVVTNLYPSPSLITLLDEITVNIATDQHPDDPGQRVKHFRLQPGDSGLTPLWVRSFGATAGKGVLHQVESLLADPVHDRLLVADEKTRNLKVYTLAGEYSGQQVGTGILNHDSEGIALYACNEEEYLIAADHDARRNTFHVLDRRTLEHLGTLRGRQLASTDGVALTQQPLGSIGRGVLFGHHRDRSIGAIRWSAIAQALELRSDCNTQAR
jgi:3-phytase